MTPEVMITFAICGTVLLCTFFSAMTTCYVATYVCEAAKVVFPNQKLPKIEVHHADRP
jgi:hypothetical protein